MLGHRAIYRHAALYDLAFSYRDYASECGFLLDWYRARRGRAPRSFLELAAGPAGHALEMASAGLDVLALDLSPEMAAWAREKAERRGLDLPYLVADMAEFTAPVRFDLAACLLCSAGYLLTDQAFLSHLASVRSCLVPGGMYVLELTHPSELNGSIRSNTAWKMRHDGGELAIDWRGDPASAVDGVWWADVSFVYQPATGRAVHFEDRASQRGFSYAQIVSLARRGGFEVEAAVGSFDENVELDDPRATRMIAMLTPG
jgi:SAM-dependent methyltransferase